MLAYRVREHNKKDATRETRATKKKNKKKHRRIKKLKNFPRSGRVQMTQQAERTRTIKYVLAESSRWLLNRRRDTKKINIPGCRKKIRKEGKEKRKTKSRKQGTNYAV